MRITNTMLKQASLSSGLPLTHSTLLDHLNNDSNDLMTNALKSRNQIMKTTGYGNLKKAAEKLMDSAEKVSEDSWYDSLAKTAEEKIAKEAIEDKKVIEDKDKKSSIESNVEDGKKSSEATSSTDTSKNDKNAEALATTEKSGTADSMVAEDASKTVKTVLDTAARKEVASVLEQLAKAYNETSNALLKDANTMNQFYRQELTKAIKDGAKALGLTLSKSGTLSFDADKMKKDLTVEELKEKLQPIANKLSFISEHVADNASANLNSVSTQYGATGKSYYNAGNRYNFRG